MPETASDWRRGWSEQPTDLSAKFVRRKPEEIVHSAEVAVLLSPKNGIGCKRLCVDTSYWATYNRPSVILIDVSGEPLGAIGPAGIRPRVEEEDDIGDHLPLCGRSPQCGAATGKRCRFRPLLNNGGLTGHPHAAVRKKGVAEAGGTE